MKPLVNISAFNFLDWINEEFIVAIEIPNLSEKKKLNEFVERYFDKG